ncbi:L,D-transpeptidase [Leptothermofonsia sp. ETS-13]|uniref:L,D-transpeptidase n=1 Tax=Leptothermofonsia sp. ETS-13 TaxID=3035696 RepID=UPI003BA15DBF
MKFSQWYKSKIALVALAIAFLSIFSFSTAFAQSPQLTAKPSRLAKVIQDLQQSNQRWIQIDLPHQRLIAWEGASPVYAVLISTGKSSTPTPTGIFSIQTRHRYARMQGDDYDISDVPYTMYYSGNYAIHGAYWHRRFGTPVSHGCVNVAVNHARWLFYWATVGTPVVVHK